MKSSSKEDVAARLKTARKRVFTTAAEAAEALGMNQVTVRAHEGGRNGVSYVDLERYARRYGVSQMWLLTGQGEEAPGTDFTSQLGELIYVEEWVDDESWFPAAEGPPGDGYVRTREGYAETVAYTDPRFPEGMVGAFKVRTTSTASTYIDGTILFCIDRANVPIQDGDHVIVVRTRGDFDNLSVRLVDRDGDGVMLLRSLSSDGPPIRFEETSREELPHISALVIGSLTRRPAPRMSLDDIRAWERRLADDRKAYKAENAEIVEQYWKARPK